MDNFHALKPTDRVSPEATKTAIRPRNWSSTFQKAVVAIGLPAILAIAGCGGSGNDTVVVPPVVDTFAMTASASFSDVVGIDPAPTDVSVTVGAYSNSGYRRSYAFGPATGRFSFSMPEATFVDGMKFPVASGTGVAEENQAIVAKLALGTTAEYEGHTGFVSTVLETSGPAFTGEAQFRGLPSTTLGTFKADARMQHAGITVLPKQTPPNPRGTIYRQTTEGVRSFVSSITGVVSETIGAQPGFRVNLANGDYFVIGLPSVAQGTYTVGFGSTDGYVGYTQGETQYAAQGFGRMHVVVQGSLTTVTLSGLRFGSPTPISGSIDGVFVYNSAL